MNLKLLSSYLAEVRKTIVDSGFKRDLTDYIASLPSNEDNIVTLRKMGSDVEHYLETIYNSDTPRYLKALIPDDLGQPFTNTDYLTKFHELLSDPSITQEGFYEILNADLTELSGEVDADLEALEALDNFIKPYISSCESNKSTGQGAIVSLIFHDEPTIYSLSHLTKSLAAWNRLLPVYHQLLKEESPEDIRVEGVESGSIDLIINLDVDVSLNLVEAFKVGLRAFAAYLSYKKVLQPYIASYVNKKLLMLEEEKDRLLLENIGEAVRTKIEEQHALACKNSRHISHEAASKKIEQVAKLFTSHIVKGNDVKLVSLPENSDASVKAKADSEGDELRKVSLETRLQLRAIGVEARQELIEMYVVPSDEVLPEVVGSVAQSAAPSAKKRASKSGASKRAKNH